MSESHSFRGELSTEGMPLLEERPSLEAVSSSEVIRQNGSASKSDPGALHIQRTMCGGGDAFLDGEASPSDTASDGYPDSYSVSICTGTQGDETRGMFTNSDSCSDSGESQGDKSSEAPRRAVTTAYTPQIGQPPVPGQREARAGYATSAETAERGGNNEKMAVGHNCPSSSVFTIILLLIAFTLGGALVANGSKECKSSYPGIVYSPARAAVEFQPVRFDGDVRTTNIFKGAPSKAQDEAWKHLYDVDKTELKAIGKESIEVPSRPGKYLAKLAVFHQLHCLDYVRRYVHNEYYHVDDSHATVSALEHADHCIDIIRQALSCSADPTLITFKPNDPFEPVEADFSATHACTNFDKVHDWATSRAINMTEEIMRHPIAYKNSLIDSLNNHQNASPKM
ncbi:uncharacterized protein GIQ15_00550 [Arthroderma uncinatum]|uniref:uncharacterized protein n=1 Tax=Arthroderma uncinatum TaxID=74035 RepID=UPI00144ABCB5|nr:uncharacterized protein GIQ15_00550 [Arthroderma uncinatum]KAF3491033.1 hypothetical protein GIQ15_00550 [Arthroderma uncinatum]